MTITNKVEQLVKKACQKKNNSHGYGAWSHHILEVVKYSKILAKKLKADQEVIELATLLHDYASVYDKKLGKDHHIHGAKLAEEVLKKYNYPNDKIEMVKHCIIAHRSSKNTPRKTIEAKIVASADALAHFENVSSLFYAVYVKNKMDIDQGTKFILTKLERDWKKLMPEAKDIIKEKYKAAKLILN